MKNTYQFVLIAVGSSLLLSGTALASGPMSLQKMCHSVHKFNIPKGPEWLSANALLPSANMTNMANITKSLTNSQPFIFKPNSDFLEYWSAFENVCETITTMAVARLQGRENIFDSIRFKAQCMMMDIYDRMTGNAPSEPTEIAPTTEDQEQHLLGLQSYRLVLEMWNMLRSMWIQTHGQQLYEKPCESCVANFGTGSRLLTAMQTSLSNFGKLETKFLKKWNHIKDTDKLTKQTLNVMEAYPNLVSQNEFIRKELTTITKLEQPIKKVMDSSAFAGMIPHGRSPLPSLNKVEVVIGALFEYNYEHLVMMEKLLRAMKQKDQDLPATQAEKVVNMLQSVVEYVQLYDDTFPKEMTQLFKMHSILVHVPFNSHKLLYHLLEYEDLITERSKAAQAQLKNMTEYYQHPFPHVDMTQVGQAIEFFKGENNKILLLVHELTTFINENLHKEAKTVWKADSWPMWAFENEKEEGAKTGAAPTAPTATTATTTTTTKLHQIESINMGIQIVQLAAICFIVVWLLAQCAFGSFTLFPSKASKPCLHCHSMDTVAFNGNKRQGSGPENNLA